MKKSILFVAIVAISNIVSATVITVSNNANSPGHFYDLQTAIDSASAYDTLYVSGSPTSYGTATTYIPLTIIGAGALPDKFYSFSTTIGTLNLEIGASGLGGITSASGSNIYGCYINTLYLSGSVKTTPSISNLIISRNSITNIYLEQYGQSEALAYNNLSISNNVISSFSTYVGAANQVINSIIKNNIIGSINSWGDVTVGSFILTDNVITGAINNVQSVVISNNIFYETGSSSAFNTNNTYCSISNNLFVSSAYTYTVGDIIYGTNSGANNLINTDPKFVYYDATVYNYTQTTPAAAPFANFNLKTGSPGIKYGTDGTDIGVYGGNTPFVEGYPANTRYRYFPMPAIPQVLNMIIDNASVLPTGTLNVNIQARKQN